MGAPHLAYGVLDNTCYTYFITSVPCSHSCVQALAGRSSLNALGALSGQFCSAFWCKALVTRLGRFRVSRGFNLYCEVSDFNVGLSVLPELRFGLGHAPTWTLRPTWLAHSSTFVCSTFVRSTSSTLAAKLFFDSTGSYKHRPPFFVN